MSVAPTGWLIILVLIGAAVVAAVVVWLLLRRTTAEHNMMACGACGYPVRGATTLSCPECGADLREAGIGKTGQGGQPALIVALVAAGAVLFGCVCAGVFGYGWMAKAPAPANPAPQTTQRGMEKAPASDDSPIIRENGQLESVDPPIDESQPNDELLDPPNE